MTTLWDQLALTKPAELSVSAPYITCRESQCLVQFLMALCSDFESLHGSILLEKFSTLPFNKSISSSLAPFDLVHFDV